MQTLVHADFSDMDTLCTAVRDWDLDFRPLGSVFKSVPGAGPLARIVQTAGEQVAVAYARIGVNLEQYGAPPPGCVTFGVLEPSVQRLWWRGQDIDADTLLVFPVGGELHSLSGPDFGVYTISVSLDLVETLCAAFQFEGRPGFGAAETVKAAPDVLTPLRRALATHIASPAGASAGAVRTIAEMLVTIWGQGAGSSGGKALAGKGPRVRGQTRIMKKALERITHGDWLDLTPSDLCAYAGVSERGLQMAFRDRFGLTPAAYLKARRLAAVNASLKAENNDEASVGDIAARYGFWHTGQFAADYRRSFGELPSETLQRFSGAKVGS